VVDLLERPRNLGRQNRAERAFDATSPPWLKWRTRSRPGRCIRFIETYCHIPTGFGAGRLIRLHRFQREVIEAVLADEVPVSAWQTCRGNAKSTLTAAIGLWAVCDHEDAPQVPLVAHDMKHAERTLFAPVRRMIKASPDLADRMTVYTASGDKRVHSWWNDGDLMPLPADEDRLQGLIPTISIIDEAQTVPVGVFWTVRQGGGKRPHSLTLLIGTPGPELDCALYRFRQLVADGGGGRYLEMAAPIDCALDDERAWEAANPALRAGFLRRDVIADEARAARLDPDAEQAFRIYRLGQWPDGDGPLDPFSRHMRRCEVEEASPVGSLVFGADIGPADTDAVIVAVASGTIEVLEQHPGTAWLPERLRELVDRHGGIVAVDGHGPIAARLLDLRAAVPLRELNTVEMARASARFAEDVEAHVMAVRPSVVLRRAVAGAQRFGTGDSWRWARRRSTADIAPLVAASVAWWVAVEGAMPGIH
jgi:hypothetical protein